MLPNDWQFSKDSDHLAEQLSALYKDISLGINGDIQLWLPPIVGTTTFGTTTYGDRSGWYIRRGLMVDVWMDVEWTGVTGTGNLAVQLPFIVINSDFHPFCGVIENAGALTLDAGYTWLTWNATPNSYLSTIRESGSNKTSQDLPMQSAGRLIGHLRYIGQEYG